MKPQYSLAAKCAAMILLVLSLILCTASIIGLVFALDNNLFTLSAREVIDDILPGVQTDGYKFDSLTYFGYELLIFIYNMRNFLWLFILITAIASVVLFVFLLASAGKRSDKDGIFENFIDRIPYDLLTAAVVLADCLVLAIFLDFYGLPMLIVSGLLLIPAFVLTMIFLCSTVVRIKRRMLLKNTLIYRILHFLFRLIHRFIDFLLSLAAAIPMIWKSVVFVILLGLGAICCVAFYEYDIAYQVLSVIALMAIAGLFILYIALCFKKLSDGCDKIAKGNYHHKIDCQNMPSELRAHGENLNSIRDGITAAVEERMRSEHMKTELITNVSHDIKTPLTSILNYTRLLKDLNLTGDAAEYIEVLDRQSNRLKKLLDDLIEVSKASTGNITPDMAPVEAGVLIGQCIGEYEERLAQKNLRLVLSQHEDSLYFYADGKLMWRIFDNIMSNICKYSLPGTRVYINLGASDDNVIITFRNISSAELNIPGDELMQRFVRGDASRSTEGSGLGLSITESLVGLQNGTLHIDTDGDLFKVTLTFPRTTPPAPVPVLPDDPFDAAAYDHE